MRTWSVTDRGLVRSENQDACAVLTPDGYTVAVVCDGMGGEKAGEMIFKDGDGKEIAVCDVVFEYDIDKKDLKTTAQMLIKYWINPQKSYILKYNA